MTLTASYSGHVVPSAIRLEIQYASGSVYNWGERINLPTIEHGLLFAIARYRHPSTRDQLIDLVWGGDVTALTINAFNVALHRLRRRLGGPDAVVYTPAGYAVCATAVVDLADLEALARVSRRSPALDNREFERLAQVYQTLRPSVDLGANRPEWLVTLSDRARALAAELGAAFGRNVLQRGNVNKALEVAYDLLDAEGSDEEAAELAMRALLECGDRAGALRVYRRYANVLARELGVHPSPRLTLLLDPPRQ